MATLTPEQRQHIKKEIDRKARERTKSNGYANWTPEALDRLADELARARAREEAAAEKARQREAAAEERAETGRQRAEARGAKSEERRQREIAKRAETRITGERLRSKARSEAVERETRAALAKPPGPGECEVHLTKRRPIRRMRATAAYQTRGCHCDACMRATREACRRSYRIVRRRPAAP